jgi:cell wall-associated NlpC family hydrolase
MKLIKRLKNAFLTVFGDMKFFLIPPVIVYTPGTFRVKGSDTRIIMENLEPGDLILRRYEGYLDGWFIPGKYSHTGIYIGNGKVVHAVAEGVTECDVIDFLRCDGCLVMRPNSCQEIAIGRCKRFLGIPYDFDFISSNKALYCYEVAAEAYKELEIQKRIPTLMFGIIRGRKTYLASSFMCNRNFKAIYEF